MTALSRLIVNMLSPLPPHLQGDTMANGQSRYAPQPPVGPNKLASLTLESVAQLGKSTAEGLRKTATDLEAGAHEIAEKLREVADAMEGHAQVANQHVSAFCDRAMEVFHGTLDLQAKLNGTAKAAAQEVERQVDDEPIPGFLTEGGEQ